jgi:hypothetical protein
MFKERNSEEAHIATTTEGRYNLAAQKLHQSHLPDGLWFVEDFLAESGVERRCLF